MKLFILKNINSYYGQLLFFFFFCFYKIRINILDVEDGMGESSDGSC